MSPSGKSSIPCEKCGHVDTKIQRMVVTYETEIELDTHQTEHRHSSSTYYLKCEKCGHTFAVVVQVDLG